MFDDFNSIKVRLEPQTSVATVSSIWDFNSINVRLELQNLDATQDQVEEFQFHKGTIRTISSILLWLEVRSFQFHKGTIRTLEFNEVYAYMLANFNSIKVRLEPWNFLVISLRALISIP